MRALIPFMRVPRHDLITSERKALPPKAHAFKVRVPTYEFWADTNIHSSKGEIKEGVFGPSTWNIVIKHTKGPDISYT